MEYKHLNNIDLRLPAIGIGTYRYLGGVKPIRRALQLGSCLIDTAEGYRGAEFLVGKAVKGLRDQAIISTKIWPTHFKYNDVIKAADNSLRRLKADYIDIYQLHWPNPSVPISETMQAMESLVDAGKVRFIGVSNFSLDQLKQAEAVMTKHKIRFNQVRYSLIDRDIEQQFLPYCIANDIMIIAYSPLAGGLHNIKAMDKQNTLRTVADAIGKTRAQIALNWCVSKKNVIAIPKANSIKRIEINCGATGWHLSKQQIELLESSIICPRGPIERRLRGMVRQFMEVVSIQTPIHEIEIDCG
ncbi:aldo/keto reductase [Candidatus Pacearchaeota archaeon]|nr:aldo/keto reductase [Candidatus Pacearchaeota archaeon]